MKKDLILFDNGNTLIDDPFDEVLEILHEDKSFMPLKRKDLERFFEYWREENSNTKFPFASNFLQEETWIINSLMRLELEDKTIKEIPFISLYILKKYRQLAKAHIKGQPQFPLLRQIFSSLKSKGIIIGIGSNDREFAARTMLIWADLFKYFDFIFTSEGLSRKYPDAEKPSPLFFKAIFEELNTPLPELRNVIYVGDSEENDVIPVKSLGISSVRYINSKALSDSECRDLFSNSRADFKFYDRKKLLALLYKILRINDNF